MTRWPALTLAVLTVLAVFTCLGCESPPDASADSGSTCAATSERNDAQCAGDLEGCPQDCLHGKGETRLAAQEDQGCPGSGCPHAPKGSDACLEAHADGGESSCAGTVNACPHAGDAACADGKLAATDASVAHPGCPHAQAEDATGSR